MDGNLSEKNLIKAANDLLNKKSENKNIIKKKIKNNNFIPTEDSWLRFNSEIIDEANRECNPIMEKINFLTIAEKNLTEFIMSKLKNKSETTITNINGQTDKIEDTYFRLTNELKNKYGIDIINDISSIKTNDEELYNKMKNKFMKDIYPILQVSIISDTIPNPHIESNSIYIIIGIGSPSKIALIKVPSKAGRLIKISGKKFVLLEDLIIECLPLIINNKIKYAKIVKVLREADTLTYTRSKSVQKMDYISSLTDKLYDRAYSYIVMIDCQKDDKESTVKEIFDIDENNNIQDKNKILIRKRKIVGGIDFINELNNLIKVKKNMHFHEMTPRIPYEFTKKSTFETISNGDVLVHYPYENFDLAALRFLEEASTDKNVIAIKQTIYRVSKNSPILKALVQAAISGKEVTVLFELKAKFDEENNINGVKLLKSHGVNIMFGPLNMKTHAKICAVIRKEGNKLMRYGCIATGNFNDKTAKIYEDYALFTKDTKKSHIVYDALILFDRLGLGMSYKNPESLLVAPYNMKSTFINLIDKCIATNGNIFIKVNGLTDNEMINKLYEASKAGIKIDIVCRGMCSLVPGVKGVSESINVKSVVGRFLEHSRIFKFVYKSDKEDLITDIYIGSADWMPRNLNNRIETDIKITDKRLIKTINQEIELYLNDNVNSYIIHQNNTYDKPIKERGEKDKDSVDVQKTLIKKYKELEEAKFILV